MSSENLHDEQAIRKLQDMVDSIDIGMLCSKALAADYPHAVPMSRQEVDDEGNIWFLISSESETHQHIQQNKNVSLLYADISSYKFLSINGTAEISQDQSRVEKYWSKMIEAWFEKGKEDPRIRVLKVAPLEAHYWDNKTNKFITFFKVALSAVSDKKLDIGREGDLSL